MSDVETTTSSRPALPTVLMALPRESGVRTLRFVSQSVPRFNAATSMMRLVRDVVDFYDRHPISEAQVLAALARRGGLAGGPLTADDLFEFDQDHYGGPAAGDAPAPPAGGGLAPPRLGLGAGRAAGLHRLGGAPRARRRRAPPPARVDGGHHAADAGELSCAAERGRLRRGRGRGSRRRVARGAASPPGDVPRHARRHRRAARRVTLPG